MKTVVICFVFILAATQTLFAQDSLTMYFDKNWNEIQDKSVADFYRKAIATGNGLYLVRDYYKSGKIQMTGSFSSKKFKEKTGHFVYYFENGHKNSEGNCQKDKNEGQWTYWFDNDVIKSEGKFIDGKKVEVWTYYNENGKLKAKEFFTKTQIKTYESYFSNGKQKLRIDFISDMLGTGTFFTIDGVPVFTGSLKNSQKDGEWIRTFQNGEMKLLFKNGELLSKPLGGIVRKE